MKTSEFITETIKTPTAKERWDKASAEREKKHNEIEARRQAAAKQGKTDVAGAIERLEKALGETTNELSIGDPVIIQGTEYNGKTGEIGEFSPSGKFVVVDLYNYGPQAFNLANVKYNEYADEEDRFDEEKVRLDPKCWAGKKIGTPKTKVKGGVRVNNCVPAESVEETAAWRRKEGKSKTGGLNKKGVASYRRENPGSKLQTAVTTKPSKLKRGSKAWKRRKSFCARMGGMKGPMKKPNGKPTRKALALRKWNCESVEQLKQMLVLAEAWSASVK